MTLTGRQYDALVNLMRGKVETAGNIAARRVLVDGIAQADAMRETGASRSTVHITVERYAEADRLIRAAYYGVRAKRMTGDQYGALVKLMRGDLYCDGNRAARRVLVDGIAQADAMRETGASRSTVHLTVKRYSAADQLIRSVYLRKP